MYITRFVVVNAMEEYLYVYKSKYKWVDDLDKATMWQTLAGAKLVANGKGSKHIQQLSFNPTIVNEIRYK